MRILAAEFAGTDQFRILRRIGAGGMGVVYEAYDRQRGQRVALKTLRHVDADTIYRLKREFRSLADLRHPNLIALHDLVVAGECFFTMELIAGVDLLSYLRGHSSMPAGIAQAPTEVGEAAPRGAPPPAYM